MDESQIATLAIPQLHCNYAGCGNSWYPRTDKLPKVCPKCKRYGWQEGKRPPRAKKGGRHAIGSKTAQLGPATKQFLEQHQKI